MREDGNAQGHNIPVHDGECVDMMIGVLPSEESNGPNINNEAR